MNKLLENAAQRAIAYLDGLDARSVAPLPEAIAHLSLLDELLPEAPRTSEQTLQRLDEIGSPATMAMAGPRFFGFVIGGALPLRWPQTGSPAHGTRTPPITTQHPAQPSLSRSRCAGCSISFICQATAPAHLSPAQRWQTSAHWLPRDMRCSARRLERRSRWPVRRAADHGNRR